MDDDIRKLAEQVLSQGADTLPAREKRILGHVAKRTRITKDITAAFDDELTYGQRLADGVAKWGGSWAFIASFGVFLAAWVALNGLLFSHAFDPYPFIFLNLILSMLAAIQAPIIMMSQNRQGAKDRATALHDYEVNLKAEIEIMALHEKLDKIRDGQLAALVQKQGEQLTLLMAALKKS